MRTILSTATSTASGWRETSTECCVVVYTALNSTQAHCTAAQCNTVYQVKHIICYETVDWCFVITGVWCVLVYKSLVSISIMVLYDGMVG